MDTTEIVGCGLDILFSLVADTLLLPATIPMQTKFGNQCGEIYVQKKTKKLAYNLGARPLLGESRSNAG
jgi:hypothetical protein